MHKTQGTHNWSLYWDRVLICMRVDCCRMLVLELWSTAQILSGGAQWMLSALRVVQRKGSQDPFQA